MALNAYVWGGRGNPQQKIQVHPGTQQTKSLHTVLGI